MTEPRGLQVTPAILLAALSIGTLCRAAEPAGDWPTWRYDAARSAACPHRLADTLHLQWVRRYPPTSPAWPDQNRLHFDTEYRPVVMGGTLFLGSPRADWVAAVDAETGRERWRTYTGGPVRFAPAAADGRLYVASDDGHLYCLDADDGSVVWRRAMSPPAGRRVLGNKRLISAWPVRGGPVLAGGRLYVAAGIWPWMGVFIRAVDPKTGETIWCNSGSGSKLRGQPHCGEAFTGPAPQGYLAVVGDRVLVPNGRAVAACFDAGTGSLRHFRYGATRADGSYFVAAGRRYYFNRKVVFGVKTGTRFRRIPGTPVVGDGVLYSRDTAYDLANAAPFRHTVADRTQTGLRLPRLWQLPDAGIGRVWIKTADKLYASCGRELVAFKFPKPGGKPSACWRAEIDGEAGSVLAGAGRLFVVTDDGSLYAYGAEQRTPKIYPIPPAVGPKWDRWARRAAEIVEATGRRAGYALVLGVESGRLVEELARQTRLHVIGIAGPGVRVDKVRRRLDRAGLYGARAAVLSGDRRPSQFPDHLAELIAFETGVPNGPWAWDGVLGLLRPYTGTLCLAATDADHKQFVGRVKQRDGFDVRRSGRYTLITRKGPLPGAGSWTHQNADVSNTVCSGDAIVKAPLGVLWFGGSSNEGILPRHGHGPCPQVVGGRILIEGGDKLRAMDVYTGRVLWEAELPGVGEVYDKTYHAGGANNLGGNYVSLPDAIYVVYKGRCLRLDPATGRKVGELRLPGAKDADDEPTWGYLGVYRDVLLAGADTQELYDPDFSPAQFPTRAENEERAAMLRRRLADVVRWLKTLDRFTPLPRGDRMSDSTWAAMNLNKLIRRRDLAALLPEVRGRDARELVESIKTYLRGKPGARNDDARLRHLNRLLLHAVNRSIPRRRHEGRGSRRSWAHASSRRLVAMDRHTGKVLWTVAARQGFLHNAICAGGGKVFVIDAYPPSFRRVLAFSDRLATAPRLLALDATTGRVAWRTEDRVFGTWLAYSRRHKRLLQAYRPSRDSVDGSWGDRMNVRNARTGEMVWERTNEYGGPCLLVGDWVITQGRDTKGEAWDIRTGRRVLRDHPVLGRRTKWRFQRSYGCGTAVASRHLLTFRSGSAGFFDLLRDGGTGNLGGFRSGCTSNMIVADGVLAVPDYTRTCSCAYHNQTSIGLVHDPNVERWTYNRMWVGKNVVNRIGLNLGAPGDRKAKDGTLWVDWPSTGLTSPDVPVAAEPGALGHFRHHSSLFEGELAWVGASGRTGLRRLTITLGEGPERTYTVRLVFAEPRRAAEPGERVFGVSVQGRRVLDDFDPVKAAGGARRTVARAVRGIKVTEDLVLELTPGRGEPLLCGIEIMREGTDR